MTEPPRRFQPSEWLLRNTAIGQAIPRVMRDITLITWKILSQHVQEHNCRRDWKENHTNGLMVPDRITSEGLHKGVFSIIRKGYPHLKFCEWSGGISWFSPGQQWLLLLKHICQCILWQRRQRPLQHPLLGNSSNVFGRNPPARVWAEIWDVKKAIISYTPGVNQQPWTTPDWSSKHSWSWLWPQLKRPLDLNLMITPNLFR